MYEEFTQEAILQEMVDHAEAIIKEKENMSGMELLEGSLIHNCLTPTAFELHQFYVNLDEIYYNTFAEYAPREELLLRAEERGLNPYPASQAIAKMVCTPADTDVPVGARFSINDLFFTTKEKQEDGTYIIECETPGSAGNAKPGEMIIVDYVEELETATLTEILIPGADEEETEALRKRYFESFSSVAFGGNRADYREKIMAIRGVGGTNIGRATSEDKTVRVCIISSTMCAPSSALVELAQNILDPIPTSGEGDGLAPIGHRVVVTGVTEIAIDIAATLTLKFDYEVEDVQRSAGEAIGKYLAALTTAWDGSWDRDENLVVRIAQVEAAILSVPGIEDVQSTLINGSSSNVTLSKTQIPKMGGVSFESN